MGRLNFDEVSIRRVKRWTDENGKRRQMTRKFFQTINPFNRRPDGAPKTRAEIMVELKAEADAWASDIGHAAGGGA